MSRCMSITRANLHEGAREAIARLRAAGAALLSQTVLLKGVNDDADTLEALMRALVSLGVKPYYLHHPDLAPGTAHFRLSLARGREIYAELARRDRRPRAAEICAGPPGGFGKIPVEAPHVFRSAGWRLAGGGPVWRRASVPRRA